MKILLLGDFSTVNLNLKYGLENLGHEVVLVSHGDGFKALNSDIKVYSRTKGENKYIGATKEIIHQYKISTKLKNFDVVQTAAHTFYHNRIDKYLFPKIFEQNDKKVLLNTACSEPYNTFVKKLPYSACNNCKLFDLSEQKCIHEFPNAQAEEYERYKRYNAIVSTHYEYFNAFNQTIFKDINHFIPVGINTKTLKFEELDTASDKINIYYGEIRTGFKGGNYIEEALDKIRNSEYANYFNIVITNRVSYSEYLKIIQNTHILIDQASSYSYGVNALIGLALGKVVLSGAEPEAIKLITNDLSKNPIINILPSANDIYNKLIWLLDNKDQIKSISNKGRTFVEEFHSIELIAKKYEALYLSL